MQFAAGPSGGTPSIIIFWSCVWEYQPCSGYTRWVIIIYWWKTLVTQLQYNCYTAVFHIEKYVFVIDYVSIFLTKTTWYVRHGIYFKIYYVTSTSDVKQRTVHFNIATFHHAICQNQSNTIITIVFRMS